MPNSNSSHMESNYAENMLSGNNKGLAIIFKSEDKIRKELTWKDLKIQVASMASFLKNSGVTKGDRVAALMPNMPETLYDACTSSLEQFFLQHHQILVDGVLDRFGQIEPKILITTDGYWYNGKEVNINSKVKQVVDGCLL